jgi:hypothetical protein
MRTLTVDAVSGERLAHFSIDREGGQPALHVVLVPQ